MKNPTPLKRWAQALRPREIPFRRRLTRAAVALIYRKTEAGGAELLFIERARREGDPWSGDMGFPGGRMQPEDATPRATAERETLEETGLELARHGHFQARLSDLVTRHHSRRRPMVVTPYIYQWQGPKAVVLNHEVEQLVWVPLDYLMAEENHTSLPWRTPLGTWQLPCCRYQGHCIWGLSYSMLREFLAKAGPGDR